MIKGMNASVWERLNELGLICIKKEIIKQGRIWGCEIISGKKLNVEPLFIVFDNTQMRGHQLNYQEASST